MGGNRETPGMLNVKCKFPKKTIKTAKLMHKHIRLNSFNFFHFRLDEHNDRGSGGWRGATGGVEIKEAEIGEMEMEKR